jgi:hypothetical protein
VLPSIRIEPKENFETHRCTPCTLASRAFLGRDSGEGGPALLDVLAAAVRAYDVALFVVGEGENLVKEFLAVLTEELVVGHGASLGKEWKERILGSLIGRFNLNEVADSALLGRGLLLSFGHRANSELRRKPGFLKLSV